LVTPHPLWCRELLNAGARDLIYDRITSTKSPATGAGKFREPRLMAQVGSVLEFVSVWLSMLLESGRWM
jgi:hypothetical protein